MFISKALEIRKLWFWSIATGILVIIEFLSEKTKNYSLLKILNKNKCINLQKGTIPISLFYFNNRNSEKLICDFISPRAVWKYRYRILLTNKFICFGGRYTSVKRGSNLRNSPSFSFLSSYIWNQLLSSFCFAPLFSSRFYNACFQHAVVNVIWDRVEARWIRDGW